MDCGRCSFCMSSSNDYTWCAIERFVDEFHRSIKSGEILEISGCFSEVEETSALSQVEITSDHFAFCCHQSTICWNFRKLPGENVMIKYFFTLCTFIPNVCHLKGKNRFLGHTFSWIRYNLFPRWLSNGSLLFPSFVLIQWKSLMSNVARSNIKAKVHYSNLAYIDLAHIHLYLKENVKYSAMAILTSTHRQL